MNKVSFRNEEVLAYLEDKILQGVADDNEVELYESLVWSNSIILSEYADTYRLVLKRMHKEYDGK